MHPIPFNRAAVTGREAEYVTRVIAEGPLHGDGPFTRACHEWLERLTGSPRALLTTSCTHALEMAALLLDLKPGDEVIVPPFTFVSTVNAIVLRGARPVFVDIRPDTLNLDEARIEAAITPRTRAILLVHYAGVACEMDAIMDIAARHGLAVVEDNAHGLFGTYKGRQLGTFGTFATLSFHDTKNLSCGEGGALMINDVAVRRPRRDHPREGHQPDAVLSRAGGQVHLVRHRLELSALGHPCGLPAGAARVARRDPGAAACAVGPLRRSARGLGRGQPARACRSCRPDASIPRTSSTC